MSFRIHKRSAPLILNFPCGVCHIVITCEESKWQLAPPMSKRSTAHMPARGSLNLGLVYVDVPDKDWDRFAVRRPPKGSGKWRHAEGDIATIVYYSLGPCHFVLASKIGLWVDLYQSTIRTVKYYVLSWPLSLSRFTSCYTMFTEGFRWDKMIL